jgi:hypothetical protein
MPQFTDQSEHVLGCLRLGAISRPRLLDAMKPYGVQSYRHLDFCLRIARDKAAGEGYALFTFLNPTEYELIKRDADKHRFEHRNDPLT